MFTVKHLDNLWLVIDSDNSEIVGEFPTETHSHQRAELMAYLLNEGMLDHDYCGTNQGFLQISNTNYGLVDLDDPAVFHNLWEDYEKGLL